MPEDGIVKELMDEIARLEGELDWQKEMRGCWRRRAKALERLVDCLRRLKEPSQELCRQLDLTSLDLRLGFVLGEDEDEVEEVA